MPGKPKDRAGEVYGALTIIGPTEKRANNGEVVWLCRCECGKQVERLQTTLIRSVKLGFVPSCGCRKSKEIGKRESYNPERLAKAEASWGRTEGTTIVGITRKKMNKNNKSGVRGVHFNQKTQRWRAGIQVARKTIGRKEFNTLEEAIEHRKMLEEMYFAPIIERYRNAQEEKE